MSNSIKISALNELSVLTSDDYLATVDSGSMTTFRVTVQSLGNWMLASGSCSSSLSTISSSYALNSTFTSHSLTSNYSISSSHTLNSDIAFSSSHALNSNNAVSSSHALVSNVSVTSSYVATASAALISFTSSYVDYNGGNTGTASYALNSLSASYSQQSLTASYISASAGGISTFPPGMVQTFATQTVPSGWLNCDGSSVLISAYPELATAIYVGDANNGPEASDFGYKSTDSGGTIRNTAGTYIKIPDLRGVFIRGYSFGKASATYYQYDTSRIWAKEQSGSIGVHAHTVNYWNFGSFARGGVVADQCCSYPPSVVGVPGNAQSEGQGVTEWGSGNGGLETVPRNFAMMYCIKT